MKCQMIFQLSIAESTPWKELSQSLLIWEDWGAIILFGISTFLNPPVL